MIRATLVTAVALGLAAPGCGKSTPSGMPGMARAADDDKGPHSPTSFAGTPGPGTHARCAVSGEEFVVDAETVMVEHDGRIYPFCCGDCKPSFVKNPAKYVAR